jgi:hypothetical protein
MGRSRDNREILQEQSEQWVESIDAETWVYDRERRRELKMV